MASTDYPYTDLIATFPLQHADADSIPYDDLITGSGGGAELAALVFSLVIVFGISFFAGAV